MVLSRRESHEVVADAREARVVLLPHAHQHVAGQALIAVGRRGPRGAATASGPSRGATGADLLFFVS